MNANKVQKMKRALMRSNTHLLLSAVMLFQVAAMLLKEARAGRRTGAAELLSRLQVYRACVETLLDAPFGSCLISSSLRERVMIRETP